MCVCVCVCVCVRWRNVTAIVDSSYCTVLYVHIFERVKSLYSFSLSLSLSLSHVNVTNENDVETTTTTTTTTTIHTQSVEDGEVGNESDSRRRPLANNDDAYDSFFLRTLDDDVFGLVSTIS